MTLKTLFELGDHVEGEIALYHAQDGAYLQPHSFSGYITAINTHTQTGVGGIPVTIVHYLVKMDDLTSGEIDAPEQTLKKIRRWGTTR